MEELTGREVAFKVLLECEEKHQFVNAALALALRENPLNEKDRSLCTELVNGVLRWRRKLDWFISQLVDYPLQEMSLPLLNILRLGFYQKLFLDKIPDHALVNCAVEMAKKYEPKASSLVNAVLRRFMKKYKEIHLPLEEENPINFLALKYSYPEWLIEYWYHQYSLKEVRSLCEINNQPAPLTIRSNQLLTTAEKLIEVLASEGVKAVKCDYAPTGLTVKTKQALTELKSYQEGLFSIQSEASMLIPCLLAPAKNSLVLDFCAGGGGKTSYLAELMENTGRIVAFEQKAEEVKRLQETVKRLALKNVEAIQADVTIINSQWLKKADYILVDAPCSGLGTIRRYADARWNKNLADIEEMAELQLKILDSAALYLKEGGRLVYAVCTNTFEENEMTITHFLKEHPYFELELLTDRLPVGGEKMGEEKFFFRTLPHRDNLDGFFAVSLRKGKGR